MKTFRVYFYKWGQYSDSRKRFKDRDSIDVIATNEILAKQEARAVLKLKGITHVKVESCDEIALDKASVNFTKQVGTTLEIMEISKDTQDGATRYMVSGKINGQLDFTCEELDKEKLMKVFFLTDFEFSLLLKRIW